MKRTILFLVSFLVLLAVTAGCKKNVYDRSVDYTKPLPFDSIAKLTNTTKVLTFAATPVVPLRERDFSDPKKAKIALKNLGGLLGTLVQVKATLVVKGNTLELQDSVTQQPLLILSNPNYTAIPQRGFLFNCEFKQLECPVDVNLPKLGLVLKGKLLLPSAVEGEVFDPKLPKANAFISEDGDISILGYNATFKDIEFSNKGITLTKTELPLAINETWAPAKK